MESLGTSIKWLEISLLGAVNALFEQRSDIMCLLFLKDHSGCCVENRTRRQRWRSKETSVEVIA